MKYSRYQKLETNFKEFEIFLWEKRRFRLRWDSSPGLSIVKEIDNLKLNFYKKTLLQASIK